MRFFVLRANILLLVVCGILALACPAFATGAGSFRDIKMEPDRDLTAEARGELRTDAGEIAGLLKVGPLVERLKAAKQAGTTSSAQLPRPVQNARMLCLWRIFIALEEVRKVIAIVNFELAKSYAALDGLTSKRDMTINMLNTFNFMQGGILGATSKAIDFKYGYFAASKEVSEVSFGVGTVMPGIGLFVPSVFKRRIDSAPNTLAQIFDQSYKPADADKSYLWKFLNSPVPGSSINLTRRQILIKHWEDFDRLDTKSEKLLKKLAASPAAGEKLTENVKVISQRIDLLHDLASHLEEFDGSLYELHKAVSID